jgi:hypothetical protein
MKRIHTIPPLIRLKDLGKVLGKPTKQVVRHIPEFNREHGRVYFKADEHYYCFTKDSKVIVPYSVAESAAAKFGQECVLEKRPATKRVRVRGARSVGVLLGHYNHGKTTILDALSKSETPFSAQEIEGTTQEIRCATIRFDSGPSSSSS